MANFKNVRWKTHWPRRSTVNATKSRVQRLMICDSWHGPIIILQGVVADFLLRSHTEECLWDSAEVKCFWHLNYRMHTWLVCIFNFTPQKTFKSSSGGVLLKSDVFLMVAGAEKIITGIQSPLSHFDQYSAPPNLGLTNSPKSSPPDTGGHWLTPQAYS